MDVVTCLVWLLFVALVVSCGLLLKCGGCKSIWYCDVKCQKKDWKRHKSTCRKLKIPQGRPKEMGMGKISDAGKDDNIVKVFPVTVEDKFAVSSGLSFNIETNYLTRSQIARNNGVKKSIVKKKEMIVKIQTSLDMEQSVGIAFVSDIRDLRVYDESRDYDVYINTSDKNFGKIRDKILKDGLRSCHPHPLLKKLYFKAHLNPDSSLDVYLDNTYNIRNW